MHPDFLTTALPVSAVFSMGVVAAVIAIKNIATAARASLLRSDVQAGRWQALSERSIAPLVAGFGLSAPLVTISGNTPIAALVIGYATGASLVLLQTRVLRRYAKQS